jgi:hypothetical protein
MQGHAGTCRNIQGNIGACIKYMGTQQRIQGNKKELDRGIQDKQCKLNLILVKLGVFVKFKWI